MIENQVVACVEELEYSTNLKFVPVRDGGSNPPTGTYYFNF